MAPIHRRPHEAYDDEFDAAMTLRRTTIQNMKNLRLNTQRYIDFHFPGWKIWDIISPRSTFYTPAMLRDLDNILLPRLAEARDQSDALKAMTKEIRRKYPGIQPVVICGIEIDAFAFGASTRGAIAFWERVQRKAVKASEKRKIA